MSPDQDRPDESGISSRPVRQLRNRNVARLLKGSKSVRFKDVVDCIDQESTATKKIPINLDKEGTLFPPLPISR